MKKIFNIFALILFISVTNVNALEVNDCEVSDAYKHWASLSPEEQKEYMEPSYCESSGVSNKPSLLRAIYQPSYMAPKTAVKNQGSTNSCWAHASTTVLESHILLNYNQYNTFSTKHMNYMESQSFSDVSVNPYGTNHDVNDGGNYYMSSVYYVNQYGPVFESTVPTDTQSDPLPKELFNNIYGKKNVYDVNTIELETRTKSGACTTSEKDLIKSLLLTSGPVGVSMNWDSSYYYNKSYLYSTSASYTMTNHAVTIVGWDDNYSRNNFGSVKPVNDGAWVVQNSWGTSWGNNGLFYISYEDPEICSTIFAIKNVDPYLEDNKYVYAQYNSLSSIQATATMNVFKKSSIDELLSEVTFEVRDFKGTRSSTTYNVYYYPGNAATKNIKLSDMTLIASGTVDYDGFVTAIPTKNIIIPGNVTEYSIAVAQTGDLPLVAQKYQSYNNTSLTAPETFKARASYLYYNNIWYDLYNSIENNRYKAPISAFTDNIFLSLSNPKVTYSYNNYFTVSVDVNAKSNGRVTTLELIKGDTVVAREYLDKDIYTGNNYTFSVKKSGITNFENGTYTLRITTASGLYHNTSVSINVLPITGITITNPKGAVLGVNNTLQMNASLTPTNYNSTDPTITWSSSDNSIAKVDANGLVTGVKKGTVTITARTTNGLTATYELNINIPITHIIIDTGVVSLNAGDTYKLYTTIYPIDTTDDKTLTWTSSNNGIATVDSDGVITAVSPGVATIKATAKNGVSKTMTVYVNGISINKSILSLELYKKYTLVATSVHGYESTNEATWTSSNPKVATVSNGVVTAKALGKTIITATDAEGNKITSVVTVTKVKASSLSISAISVKTYNGKYQKPGITVKYNGKTLRNNVDYTLKYSNNKNPGKASIKLTIKSTSKVYTGSRTIYFIIRPKKTTMYNPTTKSKSVTAKWAKTYGASGYQVGYKLKGGTWKFVYTTGTSKTFTKLTKGKYYQVIVRAYKTVDGKKYFGPWSVVKTIKCK